MLQTEETVFMTDQLDGLGLYDRCLIRETVNQLATRVIKLFSSQDSAAVVSHTVLKTLLRHEDTLPRPLYAQIKILSDWASVNHRLFRDRFQRSSNVPIEPEW